MDTVVEQCKILNDGLQTANVLFYENQIKALLYIFIAKSQIRPFTYNILKFSWENCNI